MWGILPLYWKLFDHIDSLETLAHRLLWSAIFLIPICLVACRREFLALFRSKRAVLLLLGAGLLITVNWGVFIFAVNAGHIIETSMGYYINPLMNVA
ncbi:MAG TPA: EamA family transporter RarD, partial [Coriobacteriia bacterium]|nr:EamA family transporter RarD [Coriobacteriia bacterium]